MEHLFIVIFLMLLGLALGSFVNAAVWRIKNNRNLTTDRSECVNCHHKLAWYDLIPVVSWVILRGRCRYCKKGISKQYPIVETLMAGLYVISYSVWPFSMNSFADGMLFGLWLMSLVLLAILFIYDARWFLLPDKVVFPLIAIGALMAASYIANSDNILGTLLNIGGSIAVLSGLYLLLFLISKGRWVGFGDVKLGIFLGLGLADVPLALLCLFLANVLGCLYVLPAILSRRIQRDTKVPFGPFLIVSFVISFLFGYKIVDWYMSLTYIFI